MAASLAPENFVPYYGDDHISNEESLRKILKDISQVLQMEEFDQELQDSLQRDHPNYMENIEDRAFDLLKKDCAIIVTGETSAGKSSTINLLLKTDILPEGVEATTNVICKIMHSEEKLIKIFNRKGKIFDVIDDENGETDPQNMENSSDFKESSDEDDVEHQNLILEEERNNPQSTEEGTEYIYVKENVDDTCDVLERIFESASNPSEDIHFLEIHHPIRLLKGNITLVDTPGVGDSDELNEILDEYLPYAVAFVFVVNPVSGGGIQEDRIVKVMKSIKAKTDTMICFDPADVIFLVNKWDAMFDKKRRNTDRQWRNVVDRIKQSWPKVNIENIIQMSAKLAYEKDPTYSYNFSCFEKRLHLLIDKNINKRIENSHRFLAEMLSTLEMFINSRLSAASKSLPELQTDSEKCLKRLEGLERKSKTTLKTCTDMLDDAIRKHGENLMKFINSTAFGNLVLLQDSTLKRTSQLRVGALISKRIEESISGWIEENDDIFISDLDRNITWKFQEIQRELEEILERLGGTSRNFDISKLLKTIFSEALKSGFYGFGFGFLSFSLLAPICSIPVCTAGAAVAMVLSYNYAKGVVETLKLTKKEVIEQSFLTRRNAITKDTVKKILDQKYGGRYSQLFKELFSRIIPQEIQNGKCLLKNIEKEYEGLVRKKGSLEKLSHEFAKIRTSLRSCHFLDSAV
ncbi:dynamin-like protein 1 [Saccostrea cucullata]|uniref:dynamin-like protein 1 n=1 Tax=Saccostrea cuccullata TaxID=36930 RepID=UPI002ED067D0